MSDRYMFLGSVEEAHRVLKFAAQTAKATEANPLKLGNVELWIGDGPWAGELVHFPASYAWNKPEFEAALLEYLEPLTDELTEYLAA